MYLKTTYKARPSKESGKVSVFRITRHYPNGTLVAKFPNYNSAAAHIERQTAEDAETRLRHVKDYLAERALRPAPVKVDDGQMTMF